MDTTARVNVPPATGFSSNAGSTVDMASASAHAAVESVASAAEELSRKSRPALEQAATIAHDAVDKAAHAAAPTADWVEQQAESLNAARKQLMADSCAYIRAHPLKSVGIAVAVGFVLSRCVR